MKTLKHTVWKSIYTCVPNSIHDHVNTKCIVGTTVLTFDRVCNFVRHTVRSSINEITLNTIEHAVEQLSEEFLNEKD